MPPLVALGVKNPEINALGAFQQGASNALGMRQAQQNMNQSAEMHDAQMGAISREQAMQAMELVGSIAAGSMGGDINGKPNPQRFEQGLDYLASMGVNVDQFRGKSNLAPIIARGSLTTMQQIAAAQGERDNALALRKFEQDMLNAAKNSKVDDYGFPKSGAISQKIRAYEMQGLDTQTALELASGRKSISVNPNTGERSIVDLATNEIIPLKQPDYGDQSSSGTPSSPSAENQSGPGLYDMADEATGVGSSLATGASNTLGQIPGALGDAFTYPQQVEAGQEFELFKRDLVRSLSLNPKFPVAEQQRIEGLVPRGAFTAPDTLKQSLRSLDRELARIETEMQESISKPGTPVETRQADTATLRSVRAARQRLSVGDGGGSSLKDKYGLE